MKKIFLILFLGSILLASCSEEFLDTKSLTDLSNDNFWVSEADAELGIAGCYDALQDNYLFNGDPWGGSVAGRWDYMSDNGWCRWKWMAGGAVERGENNSSSWITGDFWRGCYKAIGRCNLVIQNVGKMGTDVIDQDAKDQIIAEAKFVRALVYNYLTMTFEDVPLVTTVQDPAEANVTKSSKEDIVAFILKDLGDCVEDLAAPGTTNFGRATRGAGYALLARINLYNENWNDAIIAADKVLAEGYSLHPNYKALFSTANEMSNEVIFSVRFLRGPDEDGAKFAGYWSGVGLMNYQEALPNLGETYFCTDGRPIDVSPLYNPAVPSTDRDARFDGTLVSIGSIYNDAAPPMQKVWTKYAQRKYTEEGAPTENHFDANEDFYVFRLGHVILMKAEAIAESGGTATDVFTEINKLRPRANMPGMDQTEVDTYFGGDLVEAVRHERRVETAFEGLRYLDLKRWKIMEERVEYYNANDRVDNRMSIRTFAPKNYVWPIPQFEIDVNTALVQHELWQ
ncbi:RagB/SusD family nutrient uptake outer membrane protein [Labilibacter sediminis]|nr:RagB/SusD family nutrient uptake outer membrane protein [Labilibacter sediminis]